MATRNTKSPSAAKPQPKEVGVGHKKHEKTQKFKSQFSHFLCFFEFLVAIRPLSGSFFMVATRNVKWHKERSMHKEHPLDSKYSPVVDESMNRLCDIVRETSYAIHCYHRNGHLEKVYENALTHRLSKAGFRVEAQKELTVYDEDGTVLGEYFADLLVEERLIVEIKAVRSVCDDHISQLLGYLRASRIPVGLLINFGQPKLHIKRYLMS